MKKYIDKAAVIAEIERRKTNIKEYCLQEGHDARFDVVPEQLSHILSFLDTLEVKEEPVSEDLEFASEKYACRFTSSKYGHDKIKATFKEGAQWQKEQIMKDAIEREVKEDAGGYPYIDATELYDYDNDKPLAKAGGKVNVIIMTRE